MTDKTGGPAFPVLPPLSGDVSAQGYPYPAEGMTLRDYAQIKFTAAWIIALSARCNDPGYSDDAATWEAHRLGRMQTDAMLAEREKE